MLRTKKTFFFCIFSLIFSLFGCTSKSHLSDWMKENGKLKVLSTTSQVGDLVREVGGERVDLWVLIQGDLDPHSYELVKGDGEKFDRADLIFCNGLGLEHGASLSAKLHASSQVVSLGDEIRTQVPDQILMKEGAIDPHIWMDISLWEKAVEPIVAQLSLLDPEGAISYQERADQLISKMQQLDQSLRAEMQTIPSQKRYLVTSHDAFHYFTRRYLADPGERDWAQRFAAPEGLAPDGQLNPIDIQKMIDFLKEKQISVIFPESNVSRDSIQKIASAGKEMGLKLYI